ncbi:bis(5'-nucleosyl)-tetraphosphatase (symmetrical) YqeK [Lactococcus formosensis]|jgi:predicted HD superfamily hydrolase involved in NAD metabolism|uniref:bis(5'-nucleosyl)-tetraphosphatase (symmetrical) n=1 Tax=Lactococcus formosensis TaxID=1281486 RepID=A0A9Q8Y1T8_9LACT|nr:bis(5'-nucleosyl)-tetraphosphatase (symmetrical) YqeK [Lactococcus formosensis]MCH1722517.1 bis(5'-nucleosyl)-tetraphosphatase (symmetrical) YqeK [Lactococcus formosensis]MCO7181363.1 bis(5'-nucleosyl)-tetraphosphatase (symmetrical) YqeK [Lactococcus formosensis]MDG6111469.1 bis(5'-nucleosyl)-tetraphosphatase (symmetrical) YqeK [Lactococcus formosensis]MDG6114667.1 bis(5'-nucleosyl)-tetraphosphatase (symmetrical) YqeK [Lactococcus formosensis]MDG6116465.1 bis(5'-nucleosyl)-tetraphosphatase 
MKNTNQLKQEIETFLLEKECYATYNHCITVGDYAEEIGHEFLNEAEREQVRIAGYLHDISAIYPNNERIFVAEDMKIELFKEERQFPMIIHQKISRIMAQREFGIQDEKILSAISCHTTLKKKFSKVDLVLFVADKIRWDQEGQPPYLKEITQALNYSFEAAAFSYIDYILKNDIKVIHPWLLEAYEFLNLRRIG